MNPFNEATINIFLGEPNANQLKWQLDQYFKDKGTREYLKANFSKHHLYYSELVQKDFMYSEPVTTMYKDNQDPWEQVACLNMEFLQYLKDLINGDLLNKNWKNDLLNNNTYANNDGLNSQGMTMIADMPRNYLCDQDTRCIDNPLASYYTGGEQQGFAKKAKPDDISKDPQYEKYFIDTPNSRGANENLNRWWYNYHAPQIRDDPVGELNRDRNAPPQRNQIMFPYGNMACWRNYGGQRARYTKGECYPGESGTYLPDSNSRSPYNIRDGCANKASKPREGNYKKGAEGPPDYSICQHAGKPVEYFCSKPVEEARKKSCTIPSDPLGGRPSEPIGSEPILRDYQVSTKASWGSCGKIENPKGAVYEQKVGGRFPKGFRNGNSLCAYKPGNVIYTTNENMFSATPNESEHGVEELDKWTGETEEYTNTQYDRLLGMPYVQTLNQQYGFEKRPSAVSSVFERNKCGTKVFVHDKPQNTTKLWVDGDGFIDQTNNVAMKKMLEERRFRSHNPGRSLCKQAGVPRGYTGKYGRKHGDLPGEQIPYYQTALHNRYYERDNEESVGGFELDGMSNRGGYGKDMMPLYCRLPNRYPLEYRKGYTSIKGCRPCATDRPPMPGGYNGQVGLPPWKIYEPH